MRYSLSEKEALKKALVARSDQFCYKQIALRFVDVNLVDVLFKVPPVLSSSPKAPSNPASSSLFAAPNRRLVGTVFETVEVPLGLPETPGLPGGGDEKLDKVLEPHASLMTFIKTEVVTRGDLERYHQDQLEAIEKRMEQAVEPL